MEGVTRGFEGVAFRRGRSFGRVIQESHRRSGMTERSRGRGGGASTENGGLRVVMLRYKRVLSIRDEWAVKVIAVRRCSRSEYDMVIDCAYVPRWLLSLLRSGCRPSLDALGRAYLRITTVGTDAPVQPM